MMETNTILGTFFMLVALTFCVVVIVDRKKFFDHSSRSNNYTFVLSSFSLSLFIGVLTGRPARFGSDRVMDYGDRFERCDCDSCVGQATLSRSG